MDLYSVVWRGMILPHAEVYTGRPVRPLPALLLYRAVIWWQSYKVCGGLHKGKSTPWEISKLSRKD